MLILTELIVSRTNHLFFAATLSLFEVTELVVNVLLVLWQESCPADREIITHYQDKLPYARGKLGKKAPLMEERRTFSIPPEIANGGP